MIENKYSESTGIIREREIIANKFIAVILLILAIGLTALYVYELITGHISDLISVSCVLPPVFIIMLLVVVVIAYLNKWQKNWIKYLYIYALFILISYMYNHMPEDFLLFYTVPIVISVVYYNMRFSIVTMVTTVILVQIMLFLSVTFEKLFEAYAILFNFKLYGHIDVVFTTLILLILMIIVSLYLTRSSRYLFQRQAAILHEQAGIESDLRIAATIQKGMLPQEFIRRNEYSVSASIQLAKMVGGDFYDFFMADEKHVVILIADVSGKGIPASLFMVNAKTVISTLMETNLDPAVIFEKANRILVKSNSMDQFVTAWLGILNLETGIMKYANAGHNPPVIKRNGQKPKYLESKKNFVLGCKSMLKYNEQHFRLKPGDTIFVYTDGVNEAMDVDGNLFGYDRILDALKDTDGQDADAIVSSVSQSMSAFVGEASQSDDITMLAFVFKEWYDQKNEHKIEVMSDTQGYSDFISFVTSIIDSTGCKKMISQQIQTAVSDIFANIAMYAYRNTVGPISVTISIFERRIKIQIVDNGTYFNPLTYQTPDIEYQMKNRVEGGLGILLVQKLMDDIQYQWDGNHNKLIIVKEF